MANESMEKFMRNLLSLKFTNVFNPYTDTCKFYDRENAAWLRKMYLRHVLTEAIERPIQAIWMGRDMGYLGGRRTGLAFTDDHRLRTHILRWSDLPNRREIDRPTFGLTRTEKSATAVWNLLPHIEENIFLWNAFPLHPYIPTNELSNRAHTLHERSAGREILEELLELINPKQLICIGVNAYELGCEFVTGNLNVIPVRHPSYGGVTEFTKQIKELYANSFTEKAQQSGFDI